MLCVRYIRNHTSPNASLNTSRRHLGRAWNLTYRLWPLYTSCGRRFGAKCTLQTFYAAVVATSTVYEYLYRGESIYIYFIKFVPVGPSAAHCSTNDAWCEVEPTPSESPRRFPIKPNPPTTSPRRRPPHTKCCLRLQQNVRTVAFSDDTTSTC